MKTTLLWLLLLILISSCNSKDNSADNNSFTDTLNVALYPYVPRLDQFKSELEVRWSKIHPQCKLNFVSWDCYSEDPNENLDVFVFDNIFTSYFIESGLLMEWEKNDIDDFDDYIPYAIEGCKKDRSEKSSYYGLPQIGCTNIFYYRKDDSSLTAATTFGQICSILKPAIDTSVIPPFNNGLLLDLSGSTTDACWYIDVSMDNGVPYSWNPPLPPADSLSPTSLRQLWTLLSVGGSKQASYEDSIPYGRAIWFSEQKGRAMVNFTEAMSVMNQETLNNIGFKVLPLSDAGGVNLFYTDVVGVGSHIEKNPEKKKLAIDLANLLSSTDYITACFGPDTPGASPQYLMPVRESVFTKLSKNWPLYTDMFTIVRISDPQPFRLGSGSRSWINANKKKIKARILLEAQKMRQQQKSATGGLNRLLPD